MYVVVYSDEQEFICAFKRGKLARVDDESQMDAVQGALFASAVSLSMPTMAIQTGGGQTAEVDTGDSDFGTPSAPGA